MDETGKKPVWRVEQEWDIRPYLPKGAYITDAIPDYDGNIWFVTRPGQVGYVEAQSGDVHVITLENEEIQNTLAICADGVYIVSDYARYRFEIGKDKLPAWTWRTEYDRGSTLKNGAINQGSGTTPTLLDCPRADGSVAHLVAITDNADERVNVVVYERESGRVLAQQPVFEAGHSVSENSLIAFGRSFIVENNYTDTGAGFLVKDPSGYPGVTRIDMNASCDGCKVVWESKEASCTVVPKLSTGSGLVYLYTREKGNGIPKNAVAWYLTAVDFETGKTVYKVFTGCGRNWNNSYGPITIGPNGSAYIGVFNGLVRVSDG